MSKLGQQTAQRLGIRRWLYSALPGLLCFLLPVMPAQALNIVATTPALASIAAALTKNAASVRTITSGREDPHFLPARPTFMVMAREADLWIRMGMDLEIGWEPVLLDGARNPAIRVGQPGHFDAGRAIVYALEVPAATATRAMGDVHAQGNPHYMTDPLNARAVAIALSARLKQIDPENAATFTKNLADFLSRLDTAMFGASLVAVIDAERLWQAEAENTLPQLLAEEGVVSLLGGWRAAMSSWQDQAVIAFHKSWSYFAHRFGLVVVAQLEPLPGVPPTPGHLAQVVSIARERAVRLILREPFYPNRPARFVADQVGGMRVVEVHSYGTDAAADGYVSFIDAIVAAFAR